MTDLEVLAYTDKKITDLEKVVADLQQRLDWAQGFLDKDVEYDNYFETCRKNKELEKENEELKAENKQIIERERVVPEHYLCEMIEKCKELKAQNKTILEDNDTLNKWVDELRAQIEKMKCCFNCKNVHYDWREQIQEGICCECRNYNKWELAE